MASSLNHVSNLIRVTGIFKLVLCISIFMKQGSAFQPVTVRTRLQLFQPIPFKLARIQSQSLYSTADDAKIIEKEADVNIDNAEEDKAELKAVSTRYVNDNDLVIVTEDDGRVTARPSEKLESKSDTSTPPVEKPKATVADKKKKTNTKTKRKPKTRAPLRKEKQEKTQSSRTTMKKRVTKFLKEEIPKPVISGGFNVVLTHCTADFDTLASAVGLAKLWTNDHPATKKESTEFQSSQNLPTFVVLPRGAHPDVQKFLALHKHLFPIRSLRSLPADLSGLNRLGLVDAQRRERVGPAEHLISYADRVTIVDHHIEGDTDIPEATDYVVDEVGSVSAMIAEQLKEAGFELSEAEATLLALGIHADTGEYVSVWPT